MHPEHVEHYATSRTVRLEGRDVSRVTVVVRCGKVRKYRVILAMALMRLAARVGGFRNVKLVK